MEYEGNIDYNDGSFENDLLNNIHTFDDIINFAAPVENYVLKYKKDGFNVKAFKVYDRNERKFKLYRLEGEAYKEITFLNSKNEINKYLIDDFITT